MKKRYFNEINLWKLVYAVLILTYHYFGAGKMHISGGYFAVEFFLLTAGFFMFDKADKVIDKSDNVCEKEKYSPYNYIAKRFIRFFSWSATAFIFTYIAKRVLLNNQITSIGGFIDYFTTDIWEVLMINMNGMNHSKALLNSPAWTLSCMLIAEFILWGAVFFYKKKFLDYVLPVLLILGFGFWGYTKDKAVISWIGFTTYGLFRTLIVMGLSYYSVKLVKYLKTIDFTVLGKTVLTGVNLMCHAFVIWAVINKTGVNYQWTVLLALFISITIIMSGNSLLNQMCNIIKPLKYAGQYSMCLYLMHTGASQLTKYIYGEESAFLRYKEYILLCVIAALLQYGVVALLEKVIPMLKRKVKPLFIK